MQPVSVLLPDAYGYSYGQDWSGQQLYIAMVYTK